VLIHTLAEDEALEPEWSDQDVRLLGDRAVLAEPPAVEPEADDAPHAPKKRGHQKK